MNRLTRTACNVLLALLVAATAKPVFAAETPASDLFTPLDIFELEWASDPQLSPDGEWIAYVRNRMDIQTDRARGSIWLLSWDGSYHRPLLDDGFDARSPRWSPDGERIAYVAAAEAGSEIFVRWMDSGQRQRLSHLERDPSGITWSPDGKQIAFSMRVAVERTPFVTPPAKPEGAEWAEAPQVIEELIYRSDGGGYLDETTYAHLFVLPASGGTARQVTHGDFDHNSAPVWAADGKQLIFSANRREDWRYEPANSELFELDLATQKIRPLTDRHGPDGSPALSPDGKTIAYLGYDERYQGYQISRLYVMDRDGSNSRQITGGYDRDVFNPTWRPDGRTIVAQTSDLGNGKLIEISLDGTVTTIAADVGGQSLGRPYSSGSFSLPASGTATDSRSSLGDRITWSSTRPDYPGEISVGDGQTSRRTTYLNQDLLGRKRLATVEELWTESSHDGRKIQSWVALPPDFDPSRKYPLLLEIHGGPFANYGDRFAAEIQLYAAAGYVVVYSNPRGSTSYGEEFGNLIHHNYPSEDYDDLMSVVDAVVANGSIDPDRLFVTGGSGGGVLTAWIVGKTNRFRAAVSAKPVINWYSFVLTADAYNFFYRYWFPGLPWDHPDEYLERSPLSLVGNVETPTMLLTGVEDYRTPMSESEQYYQALKLRRIPTALVRIPGASHSIARRPSHLIAKVEHILEWFRRHSDPS